MVLYRELLLCVLRFWQWNELFPVDILGRLDVLLSFHVQ